MTPDQNSSAQSAERSPRLSPDFILNEHDAQMVSELNELVRQQKITPIRGDSDRHTLYRDGEVFQVSLYVETEHSKRNLHVTAFNKEAGGTTEIVLKRKKDSKDWEITNVADGWAENLLEDGKDKERHATAALRAIDIAHRGLFPDKYPQREEKPIMDENQRLFLEDAQKAQALNELVVQQPINEWSGEHYLTVTIDNKRYLLTAPERYSTRSLSIREIVSKEMQTEEGSYPISDEYVHVRRDARGYIDDEKRVHVWRFDGAGSEWSWGGDSSFGESGTNKLSPRDGIALLRVAYNRLFPATALTEETTS